MKAIRKTVAGVGGILLASSIATHGADLPVKAPAVAPAPALYNWSGFYLGAHVGGGWGRTNSANVDPFTGFDAGVFTSYGLSPHGIIGGGQLGYNWQFSRVVLGVEADIGYLGLDESQTIDDDFTKVDYGWYATLTGRLGYAFDNALLYVKGGAAWARITNTASDLDGAALDIDPTDFSEITKTKTGWAIGGGLEYGFSPAWSLKAEYLYMDFGSVSSTNLDGDLFDHDNRVHTAKLGVNYRFLPWSTPASTRY